jgi:tetratricopeptide (TPR) repeat protein
MKKMNILLGFLVFCSTGDKIIKKKEEVREEDKREAKILMIRATPYLQQKKYEKAIPLLEDAKKKDPYLIEIYIMLGKAYLGMKDTLKAKENFLKATEIEPENKKGYKALGFLYGFYLNNTEKGISYYKKAYEIDNKDENTILALARLYEKKNPSKADEFYSYLLKLKPEHPIALKRYLTFLVDREDYKKALPLAEKAIEKLSHDEDVMESAFKVYIKKGETKKAFELVQKLIEKDPDNYIYYLRRGDVYLAMGNTKKALEDYKKAESLNPQSFGVNLKKAFIYNDLKKYSLALQEAQEALKNLKKDDIDLKAHAYFAIAEAKKGLASLIKSKNKKEAKLAMQRWADAKQWYTRLYRLGPTTYSEYAKKMIYYTQKKYEQERRKVLGIYEGK